MNYKCIKRVNTRTETYSMDGNDKLNKHFIHLMV